MQNAMLAALGKAPKELEHVDMQKRMTDAGLVDLIPPEAWPPTNAVRHVIYALGTHSIVFRFCYLIGERAGHLHSQARKGWLTQALCGVRSEKVHCFTIACRLPHLWDHMFFVLSGSCRLFAPSTWRFVCQKLRIGSRPKSRLSLRFTPGWLPGTRTAWLRPCWGR